MKVGCDLWRNTTIMKNVSFQVLQKMKSKWLVLPNSKSVYIC